MKAVGSIMEGHDELSAMVRLWTVEERAGKDSQARADPDVIDVEDGEPGRELVRATRRRTSRETVARPVRSAKPRLRLGVLKSPTTQSYGRQTTQPLDKRRRWREGKEGGSATAHPCR